MAELTYAELTQGRKSTRLLHTHKFTSLKNVVISAVHNQDQDSLLVKRQNDNHSPGPVIRELVPSSHQRSELSKK